MQAGTFSRETSELPTLHDPPTVHTYIHTYIHTCSPHVPIYPSSTRHLLTSAWPNQYIQVNTTTHVRRVTLAEEPPLPQLVAALCLRRLQLQLACACCSGCSLLAACGGSGNKGKRRGKRRGKKTFWLFYSKTLNSHLELLLLARGLEGDVGYHGILASSMYN